MNFEVFDVEKIEQR